MIENNTFVTETLMPDLLKKIPEKSLPDFCAELRVELINIISQTGGHIGVNLGVIELTTALYRIFDFPKDSLIWDIGHQVYVQKMLTGRLNKLSEIRVNGGSPGYAFSEESEYERVTSSHAGSSLGLSLGVALARKMKNDDSFSIAVIGDGALVEGSSQEALNHIAVEQCKMLIILNDNERAIDANFGGIHERLKMMKPGVSSVDNYFTSLGLEYIGVKDGHNIAELTQTLDDIKSNLTKPTVLHIKTVKGKGLDDMALNSATRIHWNFRFDTESYENTETPKAKGYAGFAGEAIGKIMDDCKEAVLISPATLQNTATLNTLLKHPDRSYDVSLAEQHSVTLGAGFALEGIKPIVCFESTFLQRASAQIVQDLCMNNLPVLIVSARSGHTGLDHITHHALLDISYLRNIPNLRIFYPANAADLKEQVALRYRDLSQPTVVLYPYGNVLDDPDEQFNIDYKISEDALDDTCSGLILSIGPQNKNACHLRKRLKKENLVFEHIAITSINPLEDVVKNALGKYQFIITMEEGVKDGGVGSLILETLSDANCKANVVRIGFDRMFIEHGTRDYIYEKYGIDANSISNKIKECWSEITSQDVEHEIS